MRSALCAMRDEGQTMTESSILELGRQAFLTAMIIAGPPMAAALVVGVLVSVLQAATSIQEITLTFVPKIVAVFLIVTIMGPWMMTMFLNYTQGLFTNMVYLIR
jgi:flagellar biosynthetic protein FliQ